MKKLGKKGFLAQLSMLPIAAVSFGVFVLIVGFVALLLGGFRSTMTAGTAEYNVTTSGLTGLNTMGGQSNNLALVIIGVAMISILVGAFAIYKSRKGG